MAGMMQKLYEGKNKVEAFFFFQVIPLHSEVMEKWTGGVNWITTPVTMTKSSEGIDPMRDCG